MGVEIDKPLPSRRTDDDNEYDDNEAMIALRELAPDMGEDAVERLLSDRRVRRALSGISDEDGSDAVRQLGAVMQNRPPGLDPIANPSGYFLKIIGQYKRGGKEGEVVLQLREQLSGTDSGDGMVEKLLGDDDVRSTLSSLSRADGLDAVVKLVNAVENRPANLDDIADPEGYFLKILSRYTPRNGGKKRQGASSRNGNIGDDDTEEEEVEQADGQRGRRGRGQRSGAGASAAAGGREGKVVLQLRERLSGTESGKDMVEKLLGDDGVRSTLSSLSKTDGLEAVENLANSVENRPSHLDPIADPEGYFLKILNRYAPDEGQKRRRTASRKNKGGDDPEEQELQGTGTAQDQLRLANRRIGTYKAHLMKAELKIKQLTKELNDLKNNS